MVPTAGRTLRDGHESGAFWVRLDSLGWLLLSDPLLRSREPQLGCDCHDHNNRPEG